MAGGSSCSSAYQGLTTLLWPQATYEDASSLAGDAVATYSWLSSALKGTQGHGPRSHDTKSLWEVLDAQRYVMWVSHRALWSSSQ